MSTRYQVNASPITKITSWFKFLGKNLHLLDCATVWAKSKVMLTYIDMYFTYVSRYTRSMRWRIMLASEENADSMTFFCQKLHYRTPLSNLNIPHRAQWGKTKSEGAFSFYFTCIFTIIFMKLSCTMVRQVWLYIVLKFKKYIYRENAGV